MCWIYQRDNRLTWDRFWRWPSENSRILAEVPIDTTLHIKEEQKDINIQKIHIRPDK